jgi:glutathione S-transferase
MVAAAVGAELNLKLLDLMKGEHMKPEFLAVSLKHKI